MKLDPLHTNAEEFCEKVFSKPVSTAKALYTTYTGISPVLAEEVCFRAGVDGERSALAVEDLQKIHLHNIFSMMMEDVHQGHFAPCIITDANSDPVEFAAVSLTMYQDLPVNEYDSISRVLQDYYEMRDKVTRIRQKSADLRHITATAAERAARKLPSGKADGGHRKKDKYALYGELLHTYGYEAEPGADKLQVINFYTG